jgi:hypothetical protein
VPAPEQGSVAIGSDYAGRITARTDDGCAWTMLVRGNTAKLDPPVQTCPGSGGRSRTIRYWTAVSDGSSQTATILGTTEQDQPFTLGFAALSRG